MNTQRNHMIDLWRFVFSIIILIHHTRFLIGDENCLFLGGSLAVEFFFLVSGYLMMASLDRSSSSASIALDSFNFIKKKILGFYPELLIAWIISFIATIAFQKETLIESLYRLFTSIGEPFLLYSFGLVYNDVNRSTWYISSMIIAMCIQVPLIKKFPDIMKYIIMPLSCLLLWGGLYASLGTTRNPSVWLGFTYKGNIRAFLEIEMGAILYNIAKKGRNLNFTNTGKVILTCIEYASYIAVILYMYFFTATKRDFFFIILLCIAVLITFSQKGFYINNKSIATILIFLGKFSFPIYLGHVVYSNNLGLILPKNMSNHYKVLIYLICSILTAVLISSLSNYFRKNAFKYKASLRKLLLVN